MNHRITYEELATHYPYIKDMLDTHNKIDITINNEVVFSIHNKIESQKNAELTALLRKVGSASFVEYFFMFKDKIEPFKYLPIKYSLSSRKLRSSAAKSIFKKGFEEDALIKIAKSKRMKPDITNKARILLREYGIHYDKEDFISEMIKNIVPILLFNGELDSIIDELQDNQYSKNVFGIQYSLFKRVDMFYEKNIKRLDENNYPRYYINTYKHKDNEYLLCSHWENKRHLMKFENWLYSIFELKYSKSIYSTDIEEYLNDYWIYLSSSMKSKLKKIKKEAI